MSLATDSPLHSSSSSSIADFAALLDAELGSSSSDDDTSPAAEQEESVKDYGCDNEKNKKRRKVDILKDLCAHPGSIRGMCLRCGEKLVADDDGSTVALKYIHNDFRLGNDEIARMRNRDFKNLLRHKKLYLVLDLDHTLLNSTRLQEIVQDEEYLMTQTDDVSSGGGSLFRLDFFHMATKLRPFVRTFLKEASNLFEMSVYTLGGRVYALGMARLLDPEGVYFSSRVISRDDSTQMDQKGLDVVIGQESAVVILDDREDVWTKHKENLILMERYHFFASSSQRSGLNGKSLSQLKSDENEFDGALACILKVLKQIHNMFFDTTEAGVDFADRDVRKIMTSLRKEILKGCKIVFSTNDEAAHCNIWKFAERLGAICVKEVDPSVTHLISFDTSTDRYRWAVKEKKFVVHPQWIEAANYFWQKQPEENFPVIPKKSQ